MPNMRNAIRQGEQDVAVQRMDDQRAMLVWNDGAGRG
jgi:hypothetical protein